VNVELDLAELCERTGVTVRTVRYYVQQGLLPSPGTGPGVRYQQEHLDRLRLIRQLQKTHLPLVEIRRRLESLDLRGVQALLEPEQQRAPSVGDSAVDYVRAVLAGVAVPPVPSPSPSTAPTPAATRSQWEHIALGRDIELHVRRPLSRDDNRRVERLIEAALRILNEP
jgi:DNA-binding transcriptional MerR regulator